MLAKRSPETFLGLVGLEIRMEVRKGIGMDRSRVYYTDPKGGRVARFGCPVQKIHCDLSSKKAGSFGRGVNAIEEQCRNAGT